MYGEIVLGLNFIFNYTILSFAKNIQQIHVSKIRLVTAALIGAIPVVFFTVNFWTIILAFVCMTMIACGKSFSHWAKFSSFTIVGSLFAGGFLTVFQNHLAHLMNTQVIFFSATIVYFMLHLLKNKWISVRLSKRLVTLTMPSTLTLFRAEIPLTVFIDTGNNCVEPLSGKMVHFVCYSSLEAFLPAELKSLLLNWDPENLTIMSTVPRALRKDLRIVKLSTVQGDSWAIGIKYEKWVIEGEVMLEGGYIVLTKERQHFPSHAEAILHVSTLEKLESERGDRHVSSI